jgi:hypothetical protein
VPAAFAPRGPVVLSLEDTVERSRGKRISGKGIYRAPGHSSHGRRATACLLGLFLLVTLLAARLHHQVGQQSARTA